MYSPVFLSKPITSGSPPVLSISLSDHSLLLPVSSFACTSAHSTPLWRFMFFSKRACSTLRSSSPCFFESAEFGIARQPFSQRVVERGGLSTSRVPKEPLWEERYIEWERRTGESCRMDCRYSQ